MENSQCMLLNVTEVMKTLGVRSNDRAWREIRKKLILHYGMSRIGAAGYRIPMKNLHKFIEENFQAEN